MWPFSARPKPVEQESVTAATTRERLDDLEDAVEHINRRFTRLQQQVTRWTRQYDEEFDDVADDDDEVLAAIRARRNADG